MTTERAPLATADDLPEPHPPGNRPETGLRLAVTSLILGLFLFRRLDHPRLQCPSTSRHHLRRPHQIKMPNHGHRGVSPLRPLLYLTAINTAWGFYLSHRATPVDQSTHEIGQGTKDELGMQAIGNSRHSPDLVLLRAHLRRPRRMATPRTMAAKARTSPTTSSPASPPSSPSSTLALSLINLIPHITLILLGILLSSPSSVNPPSLLLNTPRRAAIAFALVVITGS